MTSEKEVICYVTHAKSEVSAHHHKTTQVSHHHHRPFPREYEEMVFPIVDQHVVSRFRRINSFLISCACCWRGVGVVYPVPLRQQPIPIVVTDR